MCNNQTIEMVANQVDGAWSIVLPDSASRRIEIRSEGTGYGYALFDMERTDSTAPKRCVLPVAHTERGIEIFYLGQTYVFAEQNRGGGTKRKHANDSGSLTAPMVGVLS